MNPGSIQSGAAPFVSQSAGGAMSSNVENWNGNAANWNGVGMNQGHAHGGAAQFVSQLAGGVMASNAAHLHGISTLHVLQRNSLADISFSLDAYNYGLPTSSNTARSNGIGNQFGMLYNF